jgi:hypothetical protein
MANSPAPTAPSIDNVSALINTTPEPSSRGVIPTSKLFMTTRMLQTPRVTPTVPIATHSQPQHALSAKPPRITPVPKSTTVCGMLSFPAA